QLMLAVRGHPDPRGPTIGDVADYLLLRHHSAVELVDRAEDAGLVRRAHDRDDQRIVRLRLTARGADKLRRLTAVTLEELARLSPGLHQVWAGLEGDCPDRLPAPAAPAPRPAATAPAAREPARARRRWRGRRERARRRHGKAVDRAREGEKCERRRRDVPGRRVGWLVIQAREGGRPLAGGAEHDRVR